MENTNEVKYDIKKTEEFINYVKNIHKDAEGNAIYSYEKTKYVKNDEKVIISCKLHLDFFQTPKKHKAGQGCPKCKITKIANKLKLTKDQFIANAIAVHHDENNLPLFD